MHPGGPTIKITLKRCLHRVLPDIADSSETSKTGTFFTIDSGFPRSSCIHGTRARAGEEAEQLHKECSGDHRHIVLLEGGGGGRARRAQVYPNVSEMMARLFVGMCTCICICLLCASRSVRFSSTDEVSISDQAKTICLHPEVAPHQ